MPTDVTERFIVEQVRARDIAQGDRIWPSSYTGFFCVIEAKPAEGRSGPHFKLENNRWTFPMADAPVLRLVEFGYGDKVDVWVCPWCFETKTRRGCSIEAHCAGSEAEGTAHNSAKMLALTVPLLRTSST